MGTWRDRGDRTYVADEVPVHHKTFVLAVIHEIVKRDCGNNLETMESIEVFLERNASILGDTYMMMLKNRVPAQEFSKTISFNVPATWWQHFKKSHFPNWLLKRFPVRHELLAETIDFRALYHDIVPDKNPMMQVKVAEGVWKD